MLETAIFLLLTIVFCTLVCTVYSRMMMPDAEQGIWAVVPGFGPGEGLEQQVRCLMWLRAWGLLRCRVVLVDGGLNTEGRQLALGLARRWPDLEIWDGSPL